MTSEMFWKKKVFNILRIYKNNPTGLDQYLDGLIEKFCDEETHDHDRHYNNVKVLEDVRVLVDKWLSVHANPYDNEETRKAWVDQLYKWILYNRTHEMCIRHGDCRYYIGPDVTSDIHERLKSSMYQYVLESYYTNIGCGWWPNERLFIQSTKRTRGDKLVGEGIPL